jgi:tetratricopeptide (TPR) repeat protein
MKRFCSAVLLLACAAPATPAQAPALKEARQLWLHGNYDEAREQYESLLKDDKLKAAAAAGLSRALESLGEYDKAIEVVQAAVKDNPRDANLLARYAEVLYTRGRWDDAEKHAEAALAVNKNHFLARWIQAQIWRDKGDLKKADAACRWFVRTYSERSEKEDDVKDPDDLLIVGLAGSENARWNNLSDQFEFILTEVYKDALKAEKSFWPAEYQAGLLLMEKYNKPEALAALDKALTLNPNAAEALAAKGVLALRDYQIKDAERFAEQALKINPKLPAALRLRAEVHLVSSEDAEAMKELEQARAVNPRDERTLARVGVCLLLQKQKAECDAVAEEVKKFDPKPAVYWNEMGAILEDRRRFEQAEEVLRRAVELRPNMPGPNNNLGMLLMRLGREEEARKLLDKGFANDPFHVRVSNFRKVLRHLEKYQTILTNNKHFKLRFDPKADGKFALYMAPYLEEIYEDLANKFQYRPQGPILIEVFTSHEMFSGRVVALPDLHTIGACTGRMVALASPHAQGLGKPFNWARVLRHELVHIFNLEQTHFLVPHWLTEGLAVNNEGFRRPGTWNELLREWAAADKLMNLDNIDLGFIRPSGPDQWSMAYCQSQLYVDYLKDRFGADAVGKLLAAYGEGLTTAAAITKACKVDKAEFEKGYQAHVAEVVKGLQQGQPAQKPRSTKELQKAYEKENDLDAGAELAVRLLQRDRKQARKLAEKVLESKKGNAKALYVLSELAKLAGDEKEERARLESVEDKASEPRVLRALGKLYYDAEEFGKAAEMFELGRKAQPYENEWLKQLARVYAQSGDKKKLIAVLEELVPGDPDEFDERVRLSRLLLEENRPAEAERYARAALEIDVLSEDARDLLVKALEAQKKNDEVKRVQDILGAKKPAGG